MNIEDWNARVELAVLPVVSSVFEYLPGGGTLIDVGANTGAVTKAALQRGAHVLAFEPVPAYFTYCARHNPEARCFPVALGAAAGAGRIWTDETNLGWNTFVWGKRTDGMTPVDVVTLPFDGYFDGLVDRIDVVKIDVEGYEYAVLAGMHQSILRFRPVLAVELGWGRSHPRRIEQVAELEWLFANGYQRIDYDFDGTTDVVLVPDA